MPVSGMASCGTVAQHAQLGPLADAHAAAHDDAVHQRDARAWGRWWIRWLRRVLLGEEVVQRRVARVGGLVEEPDVATGAECRRLALAGQRPTRPRPGSRGASRPVPQQRRHVANHRQRQRVQRLRTVQRDEAETAVDLGQRCGPSESRGGIRSVMRCFKQGLQVLTEGGARASLAIKCGEHEATADQGRAARVFARKMPMPTARQARFPTGPSSAISWLGSSRASRTASRQGMASWNTPRQRQQAEVISAGLQRPGHAAA